MAEKNYHSLNDIANEKNKHQQYKQLQSDEVIDIPLDIDIFNVDWDKFK